MKLKDLYFKLSPRERKALAAKAQASPGYLWQIATGWEGKRPSIELMQRLALADKRLRMAHMIDEFSKRPGADGEAADLTKVARAA